jgi:hypothetical protein
VHLTKEGLHSFTTFDLEEETMKKKALRKLTLSRDTVARLDPSGLERVAGGSNSACDSICNMVTCQECPGGGRELF